MNRPNTVGKTEDSQEVVGLLASGQRGVGRADVRAGRTLRVGAHLAGSCNPEPGGSARCYWNGYATQCNHPAQGRTKVLVAVVERGGLGLSERLVREDSLKDP